MRAKLILLLIMMGVLWGLRKPAGAMWLYIWITLFRPQNFTYLPLPNMVPIAFGILVLSILLGKAQNSIKFRWNIGSFHLISIMIVAFISAMASSTSGPAMDKANEVFKIILPSLLICNTISSEKDFKIVTITFAVSIGIWAVQAAIHGVAGGGSVENMAIGGQMSDRNDFAVGVVMTFPFCYYWGLLVENKKIKIMVFGVSFFVALCAIVSNSRGAMLGLIFVLMMNFLRKGTKRWRNLTIILVMIPLSIPFIPTYAIERMKTIKVGGEQTEGSAKSRSILMRAGWQGALDNPIFGVGTGCWFAHYNKYVEKMGDGAYEPHCIWIKMSVEMGFVGLGAYIFMFLRIIMNLRHIQARSLRSKNMKAYNYAGMLQLSILGYCSTATFINQIFYEYMFMVIAASGAFIRLWKEGVFEPKDQPVRAPKQPKRYRYAAGRRI